jgi:hypothetical protein
MITAMRRFSLKPALAVLTFFIGAAWSVSGIFRISNQSAKILSPGPSRQCRRL